MFTHSGQKISNPKNYIQQRLNNFTAQDLIKAFNYVSEVSRRPLQLITNEGETSIKNEVKYSPNQIGEKNKIVILRNFLLREEIKGKHSKSYFLVGHLFKFIADTDDAINLFISHVEEELNKLPQQIEINHLKVTYYF